VIGVCVLRRGFFYVVAFFYLFVDNWTFSAFLEGSSIVFRSGFIGVLAVLAGVSLVVGCSSVLHSLGDAISRTGDKVAEVNKEGETRLSGSHDVELVAAAAVAGFILWRWKRSDDQT